MISPYRIDVPQARLDAIADRVARFDWDAVPDAGGWRSGVGLADLRRLVDHWRTGFDWRAVEARLNALPHYVADLDGQRIHFVHARAEAPADDAGAAARPPILLVHGWPGSFVEFEALVGPLTAAGHDVVVPSLPGYAFSGRPASPIGPRRTAELFHLLLTELYGDRPVLLQGGDWGAAITGWLAHDHPEAVAGLHLTMVLLQADDATPTGPEEKAWAQARRALAPEETGYSHLQGSRPQSLGIAMSDSPVGVAGWILEKFGAWSDLPRDGDGRPDLWAVYDEDTLLTDVMLYVAPQAFVTSTWMYRGRVLEDSGTLPAGARIETPTAVAAFPDPVFPPPPRSLVEQTYAVSRWTPMDHGGHFAALEQPDLLRDDLVAFARDLARSVRLD